VLQATPNPERIGHIAFVGRDLIARRAVGLTADGVLGLLSDAVGRLGIGRRGRVAKLSRVL
jgi:hypothetical protein